MKINIELDSNLKEIELVIKTPDLNSDVILIKELVEKAIANSQKIIFYKGDSEYFIPLESIYFLKLTIIKSMLTLPMNFSRLNSNYMN